MTGEIKYDYDRNEAVVLYLCGMKISDVAAEYGVPYSTIYSVLRHRGIEIRGDLTVGLKETCKRGHPMDNPVISEDVDRQGKPRVKRVCRTCTRNRDKAYKKRKYDEKKAAEALKKENPA